MQPPERPSYTQNPANRPAPPVQFLDEGTARALAALAHGAIVFGLLGISFLISLGITAVIWLYAKRSPTVRFHSEQAGCYQCSVLLINIALVVLLGVAGGFSIFNNVQGKSDFGAGWVFWLLLLLFAAWWIGTIVLGVVGAFMVLAGKPFKYPFIGDRVSRSKF
jgi:uncharacterized Tic20 family protein